MTEEPPIRITPRQLDVLDAIARLESQEQAVTTARLGEELKTERNMPRQNVRFYLLPLRDLGLVDYVAGPRQSAAIRLTELGWEQTRERRAATLETLSFPIIGEVAAGKPGLADQRIEGYAARLQDVLSLHEGDFLLRVRGDSMIGVGIYPGDLVAIHPSAEEPHSGEIALVALPGEDTATLKRWHRNNGTVTLISESPAYGPMIFSVEDVQVQGCLVGHIGTGRSRRSAGADISGDRS